MRFAIITVSMLVLVAMSCSGNSAPTMPSDQVADLPSWIISVDGQDYVVGPGNLLNDRQSAAAVVPGSNMSANELRMYFAVNITTSTFPAFIQCTVFKFYMYPMMVSIPDAGVMGWVTMMEMQGFDVPNGPAPNPLC